jgi:hypothetical protein
MDFPQATTIVTEAYFLYLLLRSSAADPGNSSLEPTACPHPPLTVQLLCLETTCRIPLFVFSRCFLFLGPAIYHHGRI